MNGESAGIGAGNGAPSNRGEDAGSSKKRKRNRTILSCLPCKQKKIKCSRNIPCVACVKRGAASECRWADKEFEPPQQVFALDSVLDSLRGHFEGRLSHLERLLNVQSSESSSEVVKRALAEAFAAGALSGGSGSGSVHDGASTATGGLNNAYTADQSFKSSYSGSPEPSQSGDEAAGAAFALEVLAGGDQPSLLGNENKRTPASITHPLLPLEEFAKTSILAADSNARLEGNSRIPLLGFLNRRNITDSILACLQTKEQPLKLLDYFFGTTGWIYSATYGRMLRVEHDAFWEHVSFGQREFDLPWLALLCIVLAIALQTQQEIKLGAIQAEDMYQLSKLCLEFAEWRRCPTRRVVQTLFLSCMYMNNDNDMRSARSYLGEAIFCAQALGWHELGDDPSVMPKSDISIQDGSLLAREGAIRMWWDLLVQDWVGLVPKKHPIVRRGQFSTPRPRNFMDVQLESGMWNEEPYPNTIPTDSLIHVGKSETANFVYSIYTEIYEAGDLPSDPVELHKVYERLLALEENFLKVAGQLLGKGGPWPTDESKQWRLLIGKSGTACRSMRLHRPFMVRGYREPQRFGYSTTTCVNASLEVLEALRQLVQSDAPYMAVWFLSRHLLAAVTTIYIDVLHDADVGTPADVSDKKLVNMPYVVKVFLRMEQTGSTSSQQMGQRGRLLIQALDDAKEARRKTGGGSRQDYGRVLNEIAANVKRSSTSVTPVSQATSSPALPATASINWLDDPETRKLLASLGLLDSGNQWQPQPSNVNMNMNTQIQSESYPLNITTSLDFANTFNTGFDLLDSYTF
ncbi:hypothetical protein P389DRAFT_167560 [Cystobasidium minutum MCA 4210]|uniref:uncharacterized protein n=1 Tax=Cystobasidium minutum MCA 4210 TaxID=1397322 RepID=UPI0034CE664A|eukprot:jgi/Rhomi1/167560/fgenesh1_kg.2_\